MKRPFLFAFCSLLTVHLLAQTLHTNAEGQQVIIYPDGSYRYFTDANDTLYPATDSTLALVASLEEANERPSSPVTFRVATPEEEAKARNQVRKQVSNLNKEEKRLRKMAKKARVKEGKLADRVQELKASPKIQDRSQVEVVNQKLQLARKDSELAEKAVESLLRKREALLRSEPMSIAERQTYLAAQGIGHLMGDSNLQGSYSTANSGKGETGSLSTSAGGAQNDLPFGATPEDLATAAPGTSTRSKLNVYQPYRPASDPRLSPPPTKCVRTAMGVDEFTQKRRVQIAPELFFAYTSPELKTFLGGESLISCNIYMVQVGSVVVMEAEFVIRSQFASKEFGVLPKGSQMTLRTIDGEKINLRNQTTSQPQYDPVSKVSVYKGRYPISRGQRKLLQKSLIDQVRVMWGTGFDDYPIYDVSVLQRQLNCL